MASLAAVLSMSGVVLSCRVKVYLLNEMVDIHKIPNLRESGYCL